MESVKRELCVGGRKKISPALPKIRALEVCRLADGVTLQRHRLGTQFDVFQVSVDVISRTMLLVAFYFVVITVVAVHTHVCVSFLYRKNKYTDGPRQCKICCRRCTHTIGVENVCVTRTRHSAV